MTPEFSTLTYAVRDRKAYITLNRPERLNAINDEMPTDIRNAIAQANRDDDVRVIVLQGEGKSFCAGYDLKMFAENEQRTGGRWKQTDPWDPIRDYRQMRQNTDDFFTLWRSLKPTIAKVRGHAIAGGSDIALSADILIMADDARIGYPPARIWGCPTTAMWVFRLGAQRAKRMLLTGDTIDGTTAAEWGLALEAVPDAELDAAVERLADRMAGVPTNQLVMQKKMINQAYDNMGLESTQTIATIFDGITRNSPGASGSSGSPSATASTRRSRGATPGASSRTAAASYPRQRRAPRPRPNAAGSPDADLRLNPPCTRRRVIEQSSSTSGLRP